MKRLRHPINSIREPFGKAGLIVACLALVFAMAGGALAAKGALTGKQKKEVEKIAKKYAGKPGAPGAAGAPGATGKEGAEGAAGKEGKQGKEGKEGSPWTADGTLPKGKTETGAWAASPYKLAAFFGGKIIGKAALSFNVPLSTAPAFAYVNSSGEEGTYNESTEEVEFAAAAHCLGTVQNPKAAEGYLCVYDQFPVGTALEPEAFAVGGIAVYEGPVEGTPPILGTWAVTSAG